VVCQVGNSASFSRDCGRRGFLFEESAAAKTAGGGPVITVPVVSVVVAT